MDLSNCVFHLAIALVFSHRRLLHHNLDICAFPLNCAFERADIEGLVRLEYDFPISENDADELITHFCNDKIIEKTRYYVKHGKHIWEIDEFHKKNAGLIVAEIELRSEDEFFEPPSWIMQEVTLIGKYYNMNLATTPYESW